MTRTVLCHHCKHPASRTILDIHGYFYCSDEHRQQARAARERFARELTKHIKRAYRQRAAG